VAGPRIRFGPGAPGSRPTTIRLLADLVEIEAFKEGLRFFLDRNGNRRTPVSGGIGAGLMAIARHHVRVEPPQLDRLAAIVRRLTPDQRGLTEGNRTRLRQLDDPGNVRALLMLPTTLMRLAVRNRDRRRGARQAQLAVAIEILLMAPMRLGNLAPTLKSWRSEAGKRSKVRVQWVRRSGTATVRCGQSSTSCAARHALAVRMNTFSGSGNSVSERNRRNSSKVSSQTVSGSIPRAEQKRRKRESETLTPRDPSWSVSVFQAEEGPLRDNDA